MNLFYPLPQVYQKNVPPGEGAKIWIVQLWTYIFSMVILPGPCYILDILIVCCASTSAAGRGGERADTCREIVRAVSQPSPLESQWGCWLHIFRAACGLYDSCEEPRNRFNSFDRVFITKPMVCSRIQQVMLRGEGRCLRFYSPCPPNPLHLHPSLSFLLLSLSPHTS